MSRSLSRTSQLSVVAAVAMEPSDSRSVIRRSKTSSLGGHALPALPRTNANAASAVGGCEGTASLALTPRTPKDAFAASFRSPPSTTRATLEKITGAAQSTPRLPSMSRPVIPTLATISDGLGRSHRSSRRPKTWGNTSPSLSKAGTSFIDEGHSSFGSPRTDSFGPSEPRSPSIGFRDPPNFPQTLRRGSDEASGCNSRPSSQAAAFAAATNPAISKLLARRLKAAHLDQPDMVTTDLANFEKSDQLDFDTVGHVDSSGQATSSTSCGGHVSAADPLDFFGDIDTSWSPPNEPVSSLMFPPSFLSPVSPKREIEVLPEGRRLMKLYLSNSHASPLLFSHRIQHLRTGDKIFDRFTWDHVLQEDGDGGKVVLCQRKHDVQLVGRDAAPRFVLKMRSKASLAQEESRYREVQLGVFNMTVHPGVGYYHEFLEDQRFFYILLQYGDGGPLIQGLLETYVDGIIPESALRNVFREILQAVGHIHSQGMLHRDIKPDNMVMYADPSDNSTKRIMLIDFDYADPTMSFCRELEPQAENQFCGTPRFSAPECFLGKYSRASDLYSVGATLYLLVTGTMPFSDEVFGGLLGPGPQPSLRSVYEHMRDSRIDWSSPAWTSQPQCRNFCQELMAFNPLRRLSSAEMALQHVWLAEPVQQQQQQQQVGVRMAEDPLEEN